MAGVSNFPSWNTATMMTTNGQHALALPMEQTSGKLKTPQNKVEISTWKYERVRWNCFKKCQSRTQVPIYQNIYNVTALLRVAQILCSP
jgi:hypothetical protein